MKRLIVRCLLLLGAWLCQANAFAQDAQSPNGEKVEIVIRQAPLDVLMIDLGGRGILAGNWSLNLLDDVLRFLRQNQQNQVPTFNVRNASATGTIIGNFVEIEAQIEFTTTGFLPVQVPLGFQEGILPSADLTDKMPFRYTGPGSVELTVDLQEKHYIAVVIPQSEQDAAESNQQHIISLVLWFPLKQNGGGVNRFTLSFPQANSSQLLLEIPMTSIAHSVTRGILVDEWEDAEQQSTHLQIQGLRTDTEIAWEQRRVEVIDDRPVLLVEQAAIEIRLNAETTVYDAVLPIRSETGSFEQLQIRLPPGAVLDREMTDRYAAANNYAVVANNSVENDESIVTIRFPQRTTGVVHVQLRAVQRFDGDRADFQRTLSGFEVIGAERQTGFLNVLVFPTEMRPHWELIRSIRRAEGTAAPDSFANETRFEFISQPFRLDVRVALPQTRINVRPDYRFTISRGIIRMDARLTYTVSGSQTDVLRIQLSDSYWDFDVVSPLVDNSGVTLDAGLLTIPLNAPLDGTFDIELRASRFIPTTEEQLHRIVLPIPRPQQEQVTWIEPAPVTILQENNVEVFPVDEAHANVPEERTTGLIRQTRRQMLQAQMRVDFGEFHRQEPLFYRTEPTDAVFVADVMFRRRQLNVAMQTDVHPLEEQNQVTQIIQYNVAFGSVERIYFLVPKALEATGDIQVRLGTQTLELRDAITSLWESIPENRVRKMIQLSEPMSQFSLTFRYSLPPLTVADEGAAPLTLSLITPADAPASNHRIQFFMPPGYRAGLQPESQQAWEPFRDSRLASVGVTETFRSVQSPSRIALFISASDQNISGTTIVERAWLQTSLTGSFRVDQATYTVRSTDHSVAIQLPPGAVSEQPITVRVNRQWIQPNISQGVLTIPIAPEQHNRSVEIFIDYRFPFDISQIQVPIVLPSFTRETSVQYQFWQVILPQDLHIVGYPMGWTLEYDWTWNGLFWWRVPSIQRSDVGFTAEEWVFEPRLTESSQYVFGHLQPPAYVALYIISRPMIILFSSGIALAVGLVLIYVPQARYVGSLFGLGIALLAIMFYQPPLALLMLQAATFGVFLALGAGYVYRIFHRRHQWIPPAFTSPADVSQSYPTPVPFPLSQTVHEVVMDSENISKDSTEPVAETRE